jgi:hypothetical protein
MECRAFLKNAGLSTVVIIANKIVEVDLTADNRGTLSFTAISSYTWTLVLWL